MFYKYARIKRKIYRVKFYTYLAMRKHNWRALVTSASQTVPSGSAFLER